MERKLKEENQRKDQEKRDFEEKKRLDDYEADRQKQKEAEGRKNALDAVAFKAQQAMQVDVEMVEEGIDEEEEEDDNLLLKAAEIVEQGMDGDITVSQVADQNEGDRARVVAIQHRDWLETRAAMQHKECLEGRTALSESLNFTLNPELEMIFGPGATRLALQYQGKGQVNHPIDEKNSASCDTEEETSDWMELVTSTPKKQKVKRKKRQRSEDRVSGASSSPSREPSVVSGYDLIALGSSFATTALEISSVFVENVSKKVKIDEQIQHCEVGVNGGDLVSGGDPIVDGEGGSLSMGDVSSSGLEATVGNDWKYICDFWEHQASLEEKYDTSEEEDVYSEEEDDYSEEEDVSLEDVSPQSPVKETEGEET